MNPGVYLGMDRAEYDALRLFNQTLIKKWIELGDLPSEFRFWQEHRHGEEGSNSLVIGRALDCRKLESEAYKAKFAIAPQCDRRTKEGKALWEEFVVNRNGKSVLTQDQAITVELMNLAVGKNESTIDVFKNCKKAVLIAELFGFECKGEVDLWEEKTEHIWDLKALRDVSPRGFGKAFCDFGYDIQATFYLALARALKFEKRIFNFVCVKNEPPYTVAVHSFAPYDNTDHAVIAAQASAKTIVAIRELGRRIKADDFRDDQDWRLIDIPSWRLRQAKFETEAEA